MPLPPAFDALKRFPQFVLYKKASDASRPGKTKKFPVDPYTGAASGATNRGIFLDYEVAEALQASVGADGVGFSFTKDDPFFFIDIDGCLSDNQMTPLAAETIAAFGGAAVEVSQSGRGIHIIGVGDAGAHKCRRDAIGLEMYTEGRFVALTGDRAFGDAGTSHSAALAQLVATYLAPDLAGTEAGWTTAPCAGWNGPTEDDALIDRALRSKSMRSILGGAAAFGDLWTGNAEVLARAYPPDTSSHSGHNGSSADAALAQHLAFWTGLDCDRVHRLMLRSGLVRPKWDREAYLTDTILKACSRHNAAFLKDKDPAPSVQAQIATAVEITSNTFLGPKEQIELLRGCVYVTTMHRVLVPGGRLLRPEQFRALYGGHTFAMDARNERTSRNAFEAFTESQVVRFPKADGACFRPDLPAGEVVRDAGRTQANTWWPVEVPSTPGDPSPFLDHLSRVLPNVRDREILLAYMCAVVQHKGVKFQWAPLLQGVEGNGKSLYSRCIAEAVGRRYVHTPRADQLTKPFNGWLSGKLFINIEDICVSEGQEIVLEALKPMITNTDQAIEKKGVDQEAEDICANFMFNTNHRAGLRKSANDRRLCVFFTAQQDKAHLARDGMSGDYFPSLYRWLKHEGGYAVVTHLLQTRPIPDELNPATRCQRAPITSTTDEVIASSLGGVEQEVAEAISQGLPGFKKGWISSMAFDILLEKIRASGRITRNKRGDILGSMGYVSHPGLPGGRVNHPVLPDQGKTRLFVLPGSENFSITSGADIARKYSEDQL